MAEHLNKKKSSILAREKRVTKMIFLMIFAFLGPWTGYAILAMVRLAGYFFSDYLIGVIMLIAKAGAWLNTTVFIFMNHQVFKIMINI